MSGWFAYLVTVGKSEPVLRTAFGRQGERCANSPCLPEAPYGRLARGAGSIGMQGICQASTLFCGMGYGLGFFGHFAKRTRLPHAPK